MEECCIYMGAKPGHLEKKTGETWKLLNYGYMEKRNQEVPDLVHDKRTLISSLRLGHRK